MRELDILRQIEVLTANVIEIGLCNDQNFPAMINQSGQIEITFSGETTSAFLKNMHYNEMYNLLSEKRAYNLKMIDGALIAMQYCFIRGNLMKHRLSFFPSPSLDDFQSHYEIYLVDEIYADIVDRRIVPFPIRFDFDKEGAIPLEHPKSHLTLGQYSNCRIPVSAALTPYYFLTFIIRNFYNTAFKKYSSQLHNYETGKFADTIEPLEKRVMHMNTPLI